MEMAVALKDVGGKAEAEMSSPLQPAALTINDISKAGNDLVMKFAGDFQGMPFNAKITLVPEGADKAKVSFDIMDGAFVMEGTGVKKSARPSRFCSGSLSPR